MANLNDIFGKLGNEEMYGGQSLLEVKDVIVEKIAIDNKEVLLNADNDYNKLQVILKGDRTAYFGVKQVKKGDTYVAPKAKAYKLVRSVVRDYGKKTADWLESNGIPLDRFQPGMTFLQAIAI